MKTKTVKIPGDVLEVLERSTITERGLKLNGQLDRDLYQRVAKAIGAAGGKWDRKSGFHIFPSDPREVLGIALKTDAVVDEKKSYDMFFTPPELAKRVVELADIRANHRVLEPSAGTGSLLTAILSVDPDPVPPYCGSVIAIEINDALAEQLGKRFPLTSVIRKDFLSCNGELGKFDRIVMNPPFSGGQDIKHIEHARHMLKEGGKLVAICANGPRQREKLMPEADEWIDLDPGAFSESGTNVNAAIVIFNA